MLKLKQLRRSNLVQCLTNMVSMVSIGLFLMKLRLGSMCFEVRLVNLNNYRKWNKILGAAPLINVMNIFCAICHHKFALFEVLWIRLVQFYFDWYRSCIVKISCYRKYSQIFLRLVRLILFPERGILNKN